jgi:hypothetical protein
MAIEGWSDATELACDYPTTAGAWLPLFQGTRTSRRDNPDAFSLGDPFGGGDMRCLIHLLQESTTADWYTRFLHDRKDKRLGLIEASLELLASTPGPIRREDVVRSVGGRSSSTFYHKFGRNGPGALVGLLDDNLRRVASGRGAFDNYLAEVRVASYWPYRTAWLDALRDTDDNDRTFAAETLVLCVARWAAENRALSSQSDTAPIAAVEDLTIIAVRPLSPSTAADLLSRVITLARDGGGEGMHHVLESVRDDLSTLAGPVDDFDALVTRLGEDIARLRFELSRIPPQRARQMAGLLRPQLRLALDLLSDA